LSISAEVNFFAVVNLLLLSDAPRACGYIIAYRVKSAIETLEYAAF